MTGLTATEGVEIAPGVRLLRLGMPPGHMPYTSCYSIRDADGGVHLVDPGWRSEENLAAVDAHLATLGGPLRSIVVSHLHPDHLGLAGDLRERHGATVVLHEAEADGVRWRGDVVPDRAAIEAKYRELGVPADRLDAFVADESKRFVADVAPDRTVADGEALGIPGHGIRALHSPGHTSGSLCLVDEAAGLLWTGDHLLPDVYPGVGLGAPTERNPLEDYLDSLARLRPFDGFLVLPGHGEPFAPAVDRVLQTARHQLRRSREVAGIDAATPAATLWEVAAQVRWSDGWANLAGYRLVNAILQTGMHRRLARSGRLPELLDAFGVED